MVKIYKIEEGKAPKKPRKGGGGGGIPDAEGCAWVIGLAVALAIGIPIAVIGFVSDMGQEIVYPFSVKGPKEVEVCENETKYIEWTFKNARDCTVEWEISHPNGTIESGEGTTAGCNTDRSLSVGEHTYTIDGSCNSKSATHSINVIVLEDVNGSCSLSTKIPGFESFIFIGMSISLGVFVIAIIHVKIKKQGISKREVN